MVAFLGTAAFRAVIPAVAYYARTELMLAMGFLSILAMAFLSARALTAPLAGYFIDKGGLRRIIPVLPIVSSIILLLYNYLKSFTFFLILRILQGIVNGFFWVFIQVSIASNTPIEWRGTALAIYFALGSVGVFVGNLLYSIIAPINSSYIFLTAFILSAAAAPLTYLAIRFIQVKIQVKRVKARERSEHGKLSVHPLLLASFIIALIGAILVGDPIYVYLSEFADLSKELSALILGLTGILGLIASIPINVIADKVSEDYAIIAIAFMTCLAPFLLAVKNYQAIFIGLLAAGISWKAYTPLSRRLATSYRGQAGMTIGLVNSSMNFGTVIGLLIFGWSYDLFQGIILDFIGIKVNPTPLILSLLAPILIFSMLSLRKSRR
ncbi:MAG: hypothetical protein DRN49_05445 [Thaumarchaeota archaeon]|nr:MAG: hypothetical protein DRN49_05445 [Nitrososphaerota archaeon]